MSNRRASQLFRLIVVLLGSLLSSPLRAEPITEPPVTAEDREHWSFRALDRPPLPRVQEHAWPRNAVDHFILAEIQRKGLTPTPRADRGTLMRRLYFDLLGRPPSPSEVSEFLNDTTATAYDDLVNRLLASPAYGERWAQHWLDLARFAETDGFEHDKVRPDAWRYRDWVIQALNADLPYDSFVRLQLAGDELMPDSEGARTATAFCLSGPDMPDINSQEERRHELLNEITSTVGAVLLGLQIGCAQCHDHKYDPISQADFYRMRAIFAPAVHVKRNESVGVLREPGGPIPHSHLMERGDYRRRGPVVKPAFPRIANPQQFAPKNATTDRSSGRRRALAKWITRADNPLTARVIVNRVWQYHFGRGLSETPSDFGTIGDEPTHLELLDWLAGEFIEQEWRLKDLHRSIVTSATYCQASLPTSAGNDPAPTMRWQATLKGDPANRYFTRFPRRRLSGEAVRDAMLTAAAMTNLRQGGPGVRPPLPAELVQTLLVNQWNVSPNEADHFRRSIYVFARRNLRYPIFEAFDRPDGNASCAQRSKSTTAPQSLLLLNSEFSLKLARRFAGRVLRKIPHDRQQQVQFAIRVAFGRLPQAGEAELLQEFLRSQAQSLRRSRPASDQLALPIPHQETADPYVAAAMTDLCLALFNANEFVYID